MKQTTKQIAKQAKYPQAGAKTLYLVLCVCAVVLVLLVNIVCTALAQRYPLQIDLTRAGVFELSKTTADYLKTVTQPITLRVLATEDRFVETSSYNAQANAIMRQFAKAAPAVTLAYIDYVKNPTFATSYPSLTLKHGDVLVESGDRYKLVKTEELFNYTKTQSGKLTIASSRAEEAILSALLYVISDDVPLVTVVTGHNESDASAFLAVLTQNNFDVQQVQLATQDIPAETDVLLLVAPKNDLAPAELQKVDAFLNPTQGGQRTLLYCADAEQTSLVNLEAFLSEWGVQPADGAVFETDEGRVFNYHPFYTVADYVNTDYAARLRSASVPMLMALGRPLDVLFAAQGNVTTQVLLEYSASAGVRPSAAGEDFTAESATRRGPIPALTRSDATLRQSDNATAVQGRGTVLVSASAAMLDSTAVGSSAFSNAEYLINLFNDVCSRKDTISVTPKTIAGSALNITQQQADSLGALFVFVIPALALAFGLAVWLFRRHK